MPHTDGPIGYWKRLPLPRIALKPDGQKTWWPEQQSIVYLSHNIIVETLQYDHSFNRAAIRTSSMQRWMNKLTNKMRREAILECAVALKLFMRSHFPDGQWWLEGGSLVGALRKPHQFIPWDSDADVTMTEDTWQAVVSLLKDQHQTQTQPNAEGAPCGCLLLDMASFGSHRPGFDGRNQIPGRVVNECTGNYVDIFNAVEQDGKLVLSQLSHKHDKWSWPRAVVLPPRKCKLEGFDFNCPSHPSKYLEAYPYGLDKAWAKPDHTWDKKKHAYVDSLMLELT
jgi:hypothetical protein